MDEEVKDWKTILKDLWLRFQYFFIGYYIPVRYVIQEFFTKPVKVNSTVWKSGLGKVAVVTGANRGIAVNVIKQLMNYDYTVILGVRDVEAGNRAVQQIRDSGIRTGTANVRQLNLSSFDSVRQFAKVVLQENSEIHLLINNAGVAFTAEKHTEDLNTEAFQVNYLSHFLLTNLLLPRLHQTGTNSGKSTRIVNMASVAQFAGDFNFENLQSKYNYIFSKAYFDAKLAVVTSTKYLARKLEKEEKKVLIFCLHPGIIPTSLWEAIALGTWAKKHLGWVFPLMGDVVERVLHPALSPDLDALSGTFFMNNQPEPCNPQADNPAIQHKLWTASLQLAQLE